MCLNSSIIIPLYKYECNNTSVEEIFFTNGDTGQRAMGIYNKKNKITYCYEETRYHIWEHFVHVACKFSFTNRTFDWRTGVAWQIYPRVKTTPSKIFPVTILPPPWQSYPPYLKNCSCCYVRLCTFISVQAHWNRGLLCTHGRWQLGNKIITWPYNPNYLPVLKIYLTYHKM